MQHVSLLSGLGVVPSVSKFINQIQPASALHVAYFPKGTCNTPTPGSTQSIYDINADGDGFWRRLQPGEQCAAVADGGAIDVRDHTSGPQLLVPPSNLQSGSAPMIEVGPFKFALELERSSFSWWGPKLPADWQDFILHAWGAPSESQAFFPATPGLAAYFDRPLPVASVNGSNVPAYNQAFVGNGNSLTPKWNPIAKATHPTTGKDYGLWMSITYRYHDRPVNDPTNTARLDFTWAPITKSWYAQIWDWIKSVVAKIADFVCDKISDPAVAATLPAASAAGGPITIGVATGAMLLCGPKTTTPPAPTDAQPAITPKKPWWPWALGGVTFLGLLAYLLVPPKSRPA